MQKRDPIVVILLSFFTGGLYGIYWLYKTTNELRELSGREELSGGIDVLLTVLTVGLWGIWAVYRNAELANELLHDYGEVRENQSMVVALLGAASLISGWAWLGSAFLCQREYNVLADIALPSSPSLPRRPPARHEKRAEPEPLRGFDMGESFASNAPAPNAH